MNILLDECTPRLLKRLLTGFEIRNRARIGLDGHHEGSVAAAGGGSI